MTATCQRCGRQRNDWEIHQAEVHVGSLRRWKVQMCRECTAHVEEAIRLALITPGPAPGPTFTPRCSCGTREYPQFDPACARHKELA